MKATINNRLASIDAAQKAEIDKLKQHVATLRKTVVACKTQFEFYEKNHRAKALAALTTGPTLDAIKKADVNMGMAQLCKLALDETEPS